MGKPKVNMYDEMLGDDSDSADVGSIISVSYKEKPVTEGVTEPVTEGVTEPVTEGVTEPVTKGVTEPVTKGVTEPVTEGVTEPVTEGVTEPVTEGVTEPVTKGVTEPVTKGITEPVTKGVTEPVTKGVTEPVTKGVTEPVTKGVTEPVTKGVTEPVTNKAKSTRVSSKSTVSIKERELLKTGGSQRKILEFLACEYRSKDKPLFYKKSELSIALNLSLSNLKMCIHRLVKKGILKVEGLNGVGGSFYKLDREVLSLLKKNDSK